MGFNSIDSTGRHCAWAVPNGVLFVFFFRVLLFSFGRGGWEGGGNGSWAYSNLGLGWKPLLRCSLFFFLPKLDGSIFALGSG